MDNFAPHDLAEEGPPTLSVVGHIAAIYLNRPSRRNCLSNSDIDVFEQHLKRIENDVTIRVLVLRAHGPSFCAGYDLQELQSAATDGTPRFDTFVDRLAEIRVPTIGALSGGVYGGGADLAVACDFKIGTPETAFMMSAGRIGVHYYYGGLERFVRHLGLSTAKRLFLLGGKLDSNEMLRLGILDEIVPPQELQGCVAALAHALAANAPHAIQGMKHALNHIALGDADARAIDAAWQASLSSDDLSEGLAALQEKREPRFRERAFVGKQGETLSPKKIGRR